MHKDPGRIAVTCRCGAVAVASVRTSTAESHEYCAMCLQGTGPVGRFAGNLAQWRIAKTSPLVPKPDTKCTACGWSYAQLSNTGLAGCGHCYTVFSDALMALLDD